MSFTIQIAGMKEVKRALETYKKTRTEMLMDAGKRSAINVEREAKQNVRVDQNRLRSSIRHRTSDDPLIFDVFTDVFYAPFEEFGTGRHTQVPKELESYAIQFKGTGQGNFNDLISNIRDWARRNSIPDDAVYPIAAKIAREGRPGNAFLFPAWEGEKANYVKNVKRLL